MRRIHALMVASSLLLAPAAAQAHAYLDRANPRVGNSVATAPREVTLWFTQALEGAYSGATVVNAAGARVDTGSRVDGKVIRVPVGALPPGTYKVNWRVLSVDAHTTEGSFSFRVGGP
jgi:methionine-rich copper-binding protein CopC